VAYSKGIFPPSARKQTGKYEETHRGDKLVSVKWANKRFSHAVMSVVGTAQNAAQLQKAHSSSQRRSAVHPTLVARKAQPEV